MSSDQKFVFSDGVILRCQFVKNEYIPKQLLDLEDIVRNIKEMLIEKVTLRKKAQEDERRKSASSLTQIRQRLMSNRTNSMPEGVNTQSYTERTQQDFHRNSVILQMSPMMRRNKKKSENRYSTGQILGQWFQENAFENLLNFPEETKNEKNNDNNNNNNNKLIENITKELIPGINETSQQQDYVHIATFTQFVEAGHFLTRLLSSGKTVAVEIDVSDFLVISISYQQLNNFNQEFMMLNLNASDHMLFLRPF